MTETEEASAMKAAWVVLLLVVLAVPGFAQAPDDKLIVPGQRIGKWTLAMTVDDLVRMNGPRNPGRVLGTTSPIQRARGSGPTDWTEDVWFHSWENHSFFAGALGESGQQVVFIASVAHDSRTAQGIIMGTLRQGIEAAYGKPTAATQWRVIYDDIGLAVRLIGDSSSVFLVFRPGTAKQVWTF
jgi:hypothetical protein